MKNVKRPSLGFLRSISQQNKTTFSIDAKMALDDGCLKQKSSGLGFLVTNDIYVAPVLVSSLQLSYLKDTIFSNCDLAGGGKTILT